MSFAGSALTAIDIVNNRVIRVTEIANLSYFWIPQQTFRASGTLSIEYINKNHPSIDRISNVYITNH